LGPKELGNAGANQYPIFGDRIPFADDNSTRHRISTDSAVQLVAISGSAEMAKQLYMRPCRGSPVSQPVPELLELQRAAHDKGQEAPRRATKMRMQRRDVCAEPVAELARAGRLA